MINDKYVLLHNESTEKSGIHEENIIWYRDLDLEKDINSKDNL